MSSDITKWFKIPLVSLVLAGASLVSVTWVVISEVRMAPIKEQLTTVTAERNRYKEDSEKSNKEWKMSKDDISNTGKLLHNQQNGLKEAKNLLQVASGDFSEKSKELQNIQLELEKTSLLLSSAQEDLRKTTQQFNNSSLTIKEKEDVISEKAKKINEITIVIEDKKNIIKNITESLSEKDKEIGSITDSLNEKDSVINGISEKLAFSEKEIEKRKNDIAKISTSLNEILESMTDISSSGRNEMDKLKNGINSLLEVLEGKKKELENLKLPKIIAEIAEEAKGDFCSSSKYPFEANVKILERGAQNDIEAEFYIDSKVNFKMGKYTIDQAYQKTCFIDVIGTFLKKVKAQTLEYNELEITGLFEGGADTVIKSYVGKYKGELGSTVVIDKALVNGREVSKSFHEGKSITNADLALLRAYSVYATFRSLADSNAMNLTKRQVNFIANEYQKQGTGSRFGKITVKLHRKEKGRNINVVE